MSNALMFIGERRSRRAVKMGVTWQDGRLAAKSLFDALTRCGVEPSDCIFVNWFERGTRKLIAKHDGPRIAMGRKVQRELSRNGIEFIPMTHPAARGTIRRKDRFACHVSHVIASIPGRVSPSLVCDRISPAASR